MDTYQPYTDYKLLQPDGEESLTAPKTRSWTAANCILLLLSHSMAILTGISSYKLYSMHSGKFTDQVSITHVERLPSPAAVPVALTSYSQVVQFNGTIDFPSIYRGASPEVDRAWNELMKVGWLDLDLSAQEVWELGVDPETAAKFGPENGGGYEVTVEYAHQLHCVNLLRKVTHWNYPYYMSRKEEDDSFQHSDQAFRVHVDHCIEMLRQVLMCHADTTLIPDQWVSVRHKAWPNFNTRHQCRDFNAVHQWARSHERENQTAPLRPEGAKMLKVPP